VLLVLAPVPALVQESAAQFARAHMAEVILQMPNEYFEVAGGDHRSGISSHQAEASALFDKRSK
jgi:hypothetical protein